MALTRITDKQVTYKQGATGSVTRQLGDKLREEVSVKDFGAKGDWDGATGTDDTAAIKAAIESGSPIDFGGAENTYRVVGTISSVISHAMYWKSSGAKIIQDSPTPVEVTISVTVTALDHRIDGQLTIDAAMKSFVGLRIETKPATSNYPQDYANFYSDGLGVENVYRSSKTFNVSGEAIAVRGPFDVVKISNPKIRNCVLAAGAGVYADYGVYGITITENNYGQPQSVEIENPLIDSVYCEDSTYYFDQDGLRFISSANPSTESEPTLRVTGGTFRDCSGRSIKCQVENALVSGTRFARRSAGFYRGYGNPEIDFQEGGGKVRDIQCLYTGHVPSTVVNFTTTRQPGKVSVPYGSISGTEVIIGSGLTLEKLFNNTVLSDATSQVIRASNNEIRGTGALTYFCEFIGSNSGTGFHLLLADNVAAPTNEWVFCPDATATGTIKAVRQVNAGASAINFRRSNFATWRPIVSARDCVGFLSATTAANAVSTQGVIERVVSLAGSDEGGTVRIVGFTLANNATYTLPVGGGNTNTGLMLVSTLGAQRAGLFTRDTTGVYSLAVGTDFVAGLTSEPATGSHRTWYNTTSSAHVIKNVSGGTRTYCVLLIG